MAVMVRHFRCLKEKEAEADCSKGRSKRQKEKGGEEAGRTSTPTSESDHRRGEIRLEEGTNQSSEPTGRWDRERGPCETDDVTRAEFRRLGGPASQGEGRESGDKITERVECSSGRGGKESFIVAKRRGDAMPDRVT